MRKFLRRFSGVLFSLSSWFLLAAAIVSPNSAGAQAVIQSISPSQGPIAGGTTVTLSGSGFSGATLLVDYQPVTPVSSSDRQIVFTAPVHDNGIALVELSGNGLNAYAEFLYLPPALTSLQPGQITTVVGVGTFSGDGRPAAQAMTFPMQGFAVKQDGFYFSEPNNYVIRRVRNDGVIERAAGTGFIGYSGDGGPALQAELFHPRGMAADAAGNLYFADLGNISAIRKIDAATGIISTVGGGATPGYSGDGGPFSKAQLNQPLQVAFDGAGNLYILECGGSVCTAPRVRKVDTNQVIHTIAGTGSQGYTGDGGPAVNATFNLGPADNGGIAADAAGNVYIGDTGNNAVRRIDAATGIITTFLANAQQVRGVATDSAGNVFVGLSANTNSWSIAELSPSGTILHTWGQGYGFTADGASASNAAICQVLGIGLDLSGNILFSEECSERIRRINIGTGILDTFAGMGPAIIGDPGPPLATVLEPSNDLLFAASGDLLISDGSTSRVRRLTPAGALTDFAGNGFSNDVGSYGGSALAAPISPAALAQTPNGDVILSNQQYLLSVNPAGNISMIAGGYHFGFSGDGGPATSAIVNQVWDVASDSSGNIFFADTNNNRIRRVDASSGIVTTVAGSGPTNPTEGYGQGSTCGDGGAATSACINTPYGVALAPDGTMYIGENDQRIRMVTPAGIISTLFQGTGGHVRLSSAGNLFSDGWRIEPSGHGYQLAFSRNSTKGIGDGGPATAAAGSPGTQGDGIAIDGEGNLYLYDIWSHRLRAIRFGAVIAEPGSTVAATAGSGQQSNEDTPFATALEVTLQSPAGTPENGIRVDFAAPSSGASCVFPNGSNLVSVLTNSGGTASVVCTANTHAGAFTVTATPLALGSSAAFSLTNLAAAAAPIVTLSSGSLSFGNELVGSTTGAQTVTLSNFGGAPLNFASIAASGDFLQTSASTCTTSLNVGSNCAISITFTPSAGGARSGALTITDNAAGSPHVVTLRGTGSTVSLSSSTTSLSVQPGATATATLQLAAVGGFSGTVNLACKVTYQGSGSPTDAPTCSINPSQASVSGTGSASSTLSVATSAPSASAAGVPIFPLSGVVLAGLIVTIRARRRRLLTVLRLFLLGILTSTCLLACGGGSSGASSPSQPSNPGTTAGSYSVAVTATSGTASANVQIPLVVN